MSSSAIALSRSSPRATTTRSVPAAASCRVNAAPMPLDAPVTSARAQREACMAEDGKRRPLRTASWGRLPACGASSRWPSLPRCSFWPGAATPGSSLPSRRPIRPDDILRLWQGTFVAAMVVGGIVYDAHHRRRPALPAALRRRARPERTTTSRSRSSTRPSRSPSWPSSSAFNIVTQDRVTDPDDTRPRGRRHRLPVAVAVQLCRRGRHRSRANRRPPELVLPGRAAGPVQPALADDVIHSFWVPEFFEKRDLIPGVDNEIDVVPDRGGHLHRSVRRVLRARPLADDVHRAGRLVRPSSTTGSPSSRVEARHDGPRRTAGASPRNRRSPSTAPPGRARLLHDDRPQAHRHRPTWSPPSSSS